MLQIISFCFLISFCFNFCHCVDEAWYLYQKTIRNANREEIVVTNITAERVFPMRDNIKKWKTLTIGPTCYSVGLLDKGLHILKATLNENGNNFEIDSKVLVMENKPSDIILLHYRKHGESEVLIVVSFYDEPGLKWMKMTQNQLDENFWYWHFEYPIFHINTVTMGQNDIMLLINNVEENPNAHLYGFDLKSQPLDYWHMQSLNLTTVANTSAFNKFNSEVYLSIPQISLNTVYVYKFFDHHFLVQNTIHSPKLTMVTSFHIGFKNYLAIDGFNAAIFEFSKEGLVERKIINSQLDGVHFWLPVPIETYRDEVILFALRTLDHGSHKTHLVDVITNNGDNFEEHEDIPCTLFEEKYSWLTCLAHEKGIIGATYVSVGEKLGLLVPRPENGTVVLYMINSTVRRVPNPQINELDKLKQSKDKLQKLIDEQLEKYKKLSHRQLNIVQDESDSIPQMQDHILKLISENEDIEKYNETMRDLGLKIQEAQKRINEIRAIENRTDFDTIIVNGDVKFEGNTNIKHAFIDKINGDSPNELFEDLVRISDKNKILVNKTFTDLAVNKIDFKTVNGINASNIIYTIFSTILEFDGDVIFEKSVEVPTVDLTTKKINDINLNEELIELSDKYHGYLEFEELRIIDKLKAKKVNHLAIRSNNSDNSISDGDDNTLFIPNNATITSINGENLQDFINSLCLVNVKCYIPGNTTIHGAITAKEAETDYLNGLKFPDDFMLQDSIPHATIRGYKTFKGSLTATEIRTSGTVDGMDTEQLVTLTTDQNIPGNLIFKDLELTEELNVTGNILGEHVDKFVSNPTLEVTNFIKTNVNFKNLEVEGNIILEDHFNGQHFGDLLNDFVYSDEKSVNITSTKDFPKGLTVRGNLEIASNSINNVNLDSLVTKNTDQVLHMGVLNGPVTINNLIVLGSFNGRNITQLDESLVKLTGEQFIGSTLIFNDDIHVNRLEISGKLNDLEASEYLYTTGNGTIDENITFGNIQVENMLVKGDFNGNISNFDLKDINERYLSYTRDQNISADFHVKSSTVEKLLAETINDMDFDELYDEKRSIETLTELLNTGIIKLKSLTVNGSVQIGTVNDRKLDDILSRKIVQISEDESKKELIVEGDVYFPEVEIEKLSSIPWNDFVKRIIFKNETDVVFDGSKFFSEGISVDKLIETEKLNNILLDDIFTKEGEQDILGPLTIKGDVVFENLNVSEYVNDVPLGDILNFLIYRNGTYIYRGDMLFKRLVHIKELSVHGTVNDKKINEFFEDVVLRKGDVKIPGNIIFEQPVNITGNLAVQTMNKFNFSDIDSKIVLTTDDAEISGLVSFMKTVIIEKQMTIQEGLTTGLLQGFSTDEWLDKAVFLDKGMLKGNYTFEDININDELVTELINDVNMSRIIALGSNETLEYLEIEKVTSIHDIKVGNLVNGFKLPQEYENTVMADLDQEISGHITLKNNIVIRGNLTAKTLNGQNASKIVTTDTDQNLTATYNFNTKCTLDSDLEVEGYVSGINITTWANNSLKIVSQEPQNVEDWHILGNLTFTEDVFSHGLVNGLNLSAISQEVEERRNHKYLYDSAIIDNYKNLCTDVTYLYEKAKSQIYKFKHFEDLQQLSFSEDLKYVFSLDHTNGSYLIINEKNCLSHIFEFNGTQFNMVADSQPTGSIEQIVAVFDGDDVYLVSRGSTEEETCVKKSKSASGTVLWKFERTGLQYFSSLENQELLQESLIPGTFYGINNEEVMEFKISKSLGARKYRNWKIDEENVAFMPRGMKTGLSLRTGKRIVSLDQTDPLVENDINDIDVESIIRGTVKTADNIYIPGKNGGDITVLNVGTIHTRKSLLAVATHEETVIKGRLDLIKIYGDVKNGELFDKVPTYKPSSLLSIEFEQGETLLVFLENKRTLKVFEYKGIEGFRHRTSIKLLGSRIFQMTLPIKPYTNPRKVIGIINENKIRLIQAVMDGNRFNKDFKCDL